MNKALYRVIFNQKRGCMMVVAETTKREGKSCADTDSGSVHVPSIPSNATRSHAFCFSALGFSLCLALGIAHIAQAQGIVADKNAPKTQQATILQTGNGTPQVNIQTPTSAGVSVNQYQQFDVNSKGAILNNSRSNTQTQLGGWIQGNPWLAGGEARVIVNQINSSNPSQLNGYIEVGGRRAEVVIANPAGIAVNGGGFINASRATLTTGVPQYQAGALTGFQIRSGNVAVTGQGLDARDADYTRILSQTAHIHAPVWGKDVRVVAGQNDVAATGDVHSPIQNNTAANTPSNAPLFAIDTGALGGMYANKITLISTAEQAGIRHQGQLFASAGNVAIDAHGRLINSGTIAATNAQDTNNTAEHKVNIRSQVIENSGTVASQQGTQIQTQLIQNSGTLLSSGELSIRNSGSLKNSTSGVIEAARLAIQTDTLNNQGKLSQTGSQKLHIETQGKIDNRGRIGLPDTTPTASNGSGSHTGNSTSNSSTTAPSTAMGTGSATVSTSNTTAPAFADGTIRTRGTLNNSGNIIANGQTNVTAQQGLSNAGQMDIHQLNAKGSAFNNQNGTIISDTVRIQAGSLNNQHGNITTRRRLAVETAQLNNADGKLLSAETADLAVSGSLNNTQQAEIQAKHLNLNVGQLDNAGNIVGEGSSRIAGQNSLRNSGSIAVGELTAKGQILDNTQGQIAVDKADIQSRQLLNQNGNITTTQQLTVRSQKIDNRQGKLLSVGNAQFAVSGSLNNQQGEIIANQGLNIGGQQQNTLKLDNTDGIIQSGGDAGLTAKSLHHKGILSADNNLSITLQDNFHVRSEITAGNRLQLSVSGSLNNSSALQAGKNIHIQAADIRNEAAGSIQSNETTEILARQQLDNRGLINSNGLTRIGAGKTLSNIGTGRIYGNHIALAADTLINREETVSGSLTDETKAAVIAAGERLDIGAKHITNQENALLSSEGDLAVGKQLNNNHHAIGKADTLINAGAKLEAQGNARLSVQNVQNINNHFQTETYLAEKSGQIRDYTILGQNTYYQAGKDGVFDNSAGKKDQTIATFYLNNGSRIEANQWHVRDYRTETYKERVTQSRPAQIIAGGYLVASGQDWVNKDSQILVGKNLITDDLSAGKIIHHATLGKGRVEAFGGQWDSVTERRWYDGRRRQRRVEKNHAFYFDNQAFTHNFDTPVSVIRQNTAVTPAQTHKPLATPSLTPATRINGQRLPTGNVVSLDNSPITLPNSSLYIVNPNRNGYLVETDPQFADYRQWISSDYMLRRLQPDSNRLHKRLGDGYYEQKTVNEQIRQLTGYRRIDGYQSDEEQFKALMQNGMTVARELDLSVGVALSAEQVARLTSDIIWLENQTVTLADGSSQTVLVPKVYALARKGDVSVSGSLISADTLALKLQNGTLNNSGTLAGRQTTLIQAADIRNSGLIRGNQISLQADNMTFNGGQAQAGHALIAQANNIILNSTTQTSGDTRNGNTVIDRVAGFSVDGSYTGNTAGSQNTPADQTLIPDGTLALHAHNNIRLNAANIRNQVAGGSTQIIAKNQLNLGTVHTEHREAVGELSDANHRHVRQSAEVGSNISTQNNTLLKAGHNINIRQGDINSQKGQVALVAGRNIHLSEGRQNTELDTSVTGKSNGILSSTKTRDQYQFTHDEAVGSTIGGQSIVLLADNDINIRGSNIVSDKLTQLSAGNDIRMTAAQNHYQDNEQHEVKKSGFAASWNSGTLSVGYNKSKADADSKSTSTTVTGSQIGSIHGNTQILAGKQIKTEAASIGAGQNILMQAQDITIGAAYEHKQQQHTTQSRNKGFNINANLIAPELRQLQSRYEGIRQTAQQDNELKRNLTWHNSSIAANTEQFKPVVTSSTSSQRGNSQSLNQSSQAIGSSINAGGKAYIQAGKGDVNIVGSQVFAQQGLAIASQGDINIIGTEEYLNTQSQSRSRTTGKNDSGQFSVFIGSQTHTQEQQNHQITHSDSIVGSGTGQTQIHAGKDYTQIGSQVLSGSHIDIQAQHIDIRAADNPYRSHTQQTFTQKGLTVSVSSPLIEAVKTAQAANESLNQVGQSKNTRTNIMAAANAGWQGYQAAQSVRSQSGKDNQGAGISVTVTYGEQRNQSQIRIQGNEAQGARILADGKVTLTATGAGKNSNIHINGADIAGKQGTHLAADNQIHISAAEQNHSERSSNSQRGWNAGVALDFSNGFSLGITAGGNYGKGYGNGDETRYLHNRIGDQGSQTTLNSGGTTTLKGTQVMGKGIQINAQNLTIETPQDTAQYHSKQYQGSAQVTVGYGFSGSADYSQSKTNASHQSVTQQSGIFAGDDGYQIQIKDNTDLKGGIITSSQSAEDSGKNRLTTGTLSFNDIRNHSRYEGESFGVGASIAVSGDTLGQGAQNNPRQSRLSTVADKNGAGSSIGYGSDSGSRSSVTKSGINTRNIIITDEKEQIRLTGKAAEQTKAEIQTKLSTEALQDNPSLSGSLKNTFDKDAVQSELDLQRTVSQQFSQTSQQAGTHINKKYDEQKAKETAAIKAAEEALANNDMATYVIKIKEAADAEKSAANWQRGGVLLNMISAGLSAPTQSTAGIAAATASPALSYQIGQYFKGLAQENQRTGKTQEAELTTGQQTAHILAHAVLGAATAAAGDNNALAGAISAGGAEAAAPVISGWLYGETDGSRLNAEQKETVTAITNLLGTAAGAAVGNATADAVQGSLNAQGAVGNNSLTNDLAMKYAVEISRAKTEIERQKIRANIARDSYTLTHKASTCQTENQCKVVLAELQRYFAQFNGIASHYEKTGSPQEKEWAHFLREQQKETLADISRVGKRLTYLADIQTNSKGRNNNLTSNLPSIFKSNNGRVWNDGREAAGIGQPMPDYIAVQAAAATIYIPLYGKPNIYVGGSIARDQNFKPSYGLSVRFGDIQTEADKSLEEAGVYHPSTKWYPNTRAKIINDFLPGVSGSMGGCVTYACINRVSTIPQNINDKSQTAYEYGIGVGFSGISPYSFNVEGGVTSSLNSILESYKDTNSTKKEAGK